MIRFKKDGSVAFTESDNGDLVVRDAKIAEAVEADGVAVIREDKEKEDDK